MRDIVKFSITLSTNQVIRIRECGTLESLKGNRYVLESLSNGAFTTKNQYFPSQEAAQGVLDKVYCLDVLQKTKNKAMAKIDEGFEDSIRGTYEYDFYQFLDGIIIDDYIIKYDDWSVAVCSITSNPLTLKQRQFLLTYNFPTNVNGYEIEDQEGHYVFSLKTHTDDKVIFWTVPLEAEEANGESYKYLFEAKLHPTYSKYI